ncbi:hypothetical protein [Clostridium muellerianum]|uniref:hypothetical protein n=1 Tax=Clostridium muellerianum TaxID=2716538 RepID=UPI001FAD2E72|nr:hypothetical protein [Clostridium muellerianum]
MMQSFSEATETISKGVQDLNAITEAVQASMDEIAMNTSNLEDKAEESKISGNDI